jgi:hypothetical protein
MVFALSDLPEGAMTHRVKDGQVAGTKHDFDGHA